MKKSMMKIFICATTLLLVALTVFGAAALTYQYSTQESLTTSGDIAQTTENTAVVFANPYYGTIISSIDASFGAYMGDDCRLSIYGSNDGVNFTLLADQTNPAFGPTINYSTPSNYAYYKFISERTSGFSYSFYVGIPDNTTFFAVNGFATPVINVELNV